MTIRLQSLLVSLCLGLLLAPSLSAQQSGQIYGHVQTVDAEGELLHLVGVQLILVSKADPSLRFQTQSDDTGVYSFTGLPPGAYTLKATLEGYDEKTQEVTVEAGALLEVTIDLVLEAVREEVTVEAQPEGIQPEETTTRERIQSQTLRNAPLVAERFVEALPLLPGVVRGPDGLINIKGAPSTHTGWLVNSANVTDPVTGDKAINLPIDVIQTVEVLSNPYDAQYGKFAGAVTTVETKPSADKFTFMIDNFLPRLRRRNDAIRGIESATPRVTFSGPIVQGRFAFLQSFEYRLNRAPTTSLPELVQDTTIESFDSFTQFDITFSPTHRLTPVFSVYPEKQQFATLDTFNPQPATANYRQRGWMGGGRDQYIFSNGSLLESQFSIKEFDADVFPAGLGEEFLRPPVCDIGAFPANTLLTFVLRPECNLGSFFNIQNRTSRRYEWLEQYNFAPMQGRGQHQVKAGFAFSRATFRGFHFGQPVEVRRNDGTLSERIEFVGNPEIDRDITEYTLFLHNKWNVHPRLTFDFGLRYDYDTIANESNFAPRLAFAYVLTSDNKTLLRAGVGLFYDKVPLNVGYFPQLQRRVVTLFDPAGNPLGPPRRFVNRLEDPENPRSLAFSLEIDREIRPGLVLRLSYMQREERDEYLVEPFDTLNGLPTLQVASRGRARYREFQATANWRFQEDSFLNISYVHSESAGDLNTFQQFFGNFQNPIIRANERSRSNVDVPDRLLVWGEIKLPYGVRWFPVLDWRSGFPFSLLDETQNFVGARNQGGRFPQFVSFDFQLFKDFRVKAFGKVRRIRVGFKVFNVFDHFNPRDIQNNLDAFTTGGLFNSRGRLFRGKFGIEF